ncbi:MAG: hypothetical protein MIO93_08225 [ANME-2 cluster archaeon]|nr:hypothetical protein [ANME-2 cluster archaeon]
MINKNKVNIDISMKWNKEQKKRSIHTTLKPSTIAKLEEYGDGKLKNVTNLLEMDTVPGKNWRQIISKYEHESCMHGHKCCSKTRLQNDI